MLPNHEYCLNGTCQLKVMIGTMICPEAVPTVAKHLYDHPEGLSPRMTPRGEPGFCNEPDLAWFNSVARSCDNFVEATGNIGDVYLMHPLSQCLFRAAFLMKNISLSLQ